LEELLREGVQHLNNMSDTEFTAMCRYIHATGGDLTTRNSKVNLKIDGCSLRIGMYERKFFIESSRSGPQHIPGAFSEYTKNKKGSPDQISASYDRVLESLIHHRPMQKLLEGLAVEGLDEFYGVDRGVKMFCELLYTPLAFESDGKSKFLVTEYDNDRLGKLMTLVFYKVEDIMGHTPYDESKIFKALRSISSKAVRIYDQRVECDRFHISDLVARACGPNPPMESLKTEMAERLLSSPFRHPLRGDDFEGLVFYVDMYQGKHVFKVITDLYAKGKKLRDASFRSKR
jgi:hypothetical protein